MANVQGTQVGDLLTGTAGDDTIFGLGGNDSLYGGTGDDIVEGGDGDDFFYDRDGGSDTLRGGSGVDRFYLLRDIYGEPTETVTIEGGEGDDEISYYSWRSIGATIDGGAGDDLITLERMSTGTRLVLGDGRDTVVLGTAPSSYYGLLTIDDFRTGAVGDKIEWTDSLNNLLSDWDQSLNPFASGHLSFRQSGSDAILQIDVDGAAGAQSAYDAIVFHNANAGEFSAANLDGYASDGSLAAAVTLIGGDPAELLRGGGGHDRIEGGAGDDTIEGGGGDDRLAGGNDRDRLRGGSGDDILLGEAGDDLLADTSGGDDLLSGGAGSDTLYLYRLNNTLTEQVVLRGEDGADRLTDWSYAAGRVTLDGGAGDDIVALWTSDHSHAITLGTGADTIDLNSFQTFRMDTTARQVRDFVAGDGGDTISLRDLLTGVTAWDGSGNPFASGDLQLVERNGSTIVQIKLDIYPNGVQDLLTLRGVARETLTAANFGGFAPDGSMAPGETLTGTDSGEALAGGLGNDTIIGLRGDDTLTGDAGADRLDGGEGNDNLDGGSGDDILDGGAGDDFMQVTGGGSDQLIGGAGRDFIINYRNWTGVTENVAIDAGTDDDVVVYQNFNPGSVTIDLGEGADTVRMLGHRGRGAITLGDGADTLDLNDLYSTGLFGEYVIDVADYRAGEDRILLRDFLPRALKGWDEQTNPFAEGFLRIRQAGDDVAVTIDLDGRGSQYRPQQFLILRDVDLTALGERDFDGIAPDGSDPDRSILGTDRAETLRGGTGADMIDGGKGNDRLTGGAGDDALTGGDGNDLLSGDTGRDVLTGGGGRDTFRFAAGDSDAMPDRADVIADFDRTQRDRIDLTAIDADSVTAGDQAFAYVGRAAFSGVAGELRFERAGDDGYLLGDINGDGLADLAIRLDHVSGLAVRDLML